MVGNSKTYQVIPNEEDRSTSLSSTIRSPSLGSGLNEPITNENYALSPRRIQNQVLTLSGWGAIRGGLLFASSKLNRISSDSIDKSQSTKVGVYRCWCLSVLAYLLTHWIDLWAWPPVLDWKATARLTLKKLFPSVLWSQLLKQIRHNADIAAHHGFEVIVKSLPDRNYRDWCKI